METCVCTNGGTSHVWIEVGGIKELAKGMHCIIHRFTLDIKTLLKLLQEELDSLVTIVNLIKSSAPNIRIFKELGNNNDSDHEVLHFYAAVRWLSKINIVRRAFIQE